jgi:hypothetical protein
MDGQNDGGKDRKGALNEKKQNFRFGVDYSDVGRWTGAGKL